MNIAFSLWHSEAGLSKLISILLYFNEVLCIGVIFLVGHQALLDTYEGGEIQMI